MIDDIKYGIAYLNEVRPNWYNEINIDELDMLEDDKCILGQLYGSFKWFTTAGYKSLYWAEDRGFALYIRGGSYEELAELWKIEIRRLQLS